MSKTGWLLIMGAASLLGPSLHASHIQTAECTGWCTLHEPRVSAPAGTTGRSSASRLALEGFRQLVSAVSVQRLVAAVPTVRKAISLLKDEGLVTGVAGYGTFVAEKREDA
jgi:hypothetical protein